MGREASLRPLGTGFYIQVRMAHTGCILVCGSMLCIIRNLSFSTSTHQDPPTQTDRQQASKSPHPIDTHTHNVIQSLNWVQSTYEM